ncbi:MAG: SPOR domain-containing protein [Candidatus Kaistia colombiensis]|nr:MAG: SPOR domain-containing protein [Kaistia sp.]
MVSSAGGKDKLQAALDAAVVRAASERSADVPVIQLGVFSNLANAQAVAGRFTELGRATATPITVGGKTMQSVRLVLADRSMSGQDAVESVRAAGLSGAYLVTR